MNRRLSLSVTFLIATSFVLSVSPPLFAAKGGGGHGGSGGHGGGHAGGHVSGGSFSGHSSGHSAGRSLGRIFGHHSGSRGTLPKENPNDRVQSPAHPLPVAFANMRTRRRIFHGSQFFGSGYCDLFRFTRRDALFTGESDCFSGSFLFDPLFYGASLSTYFWSDSLTDPGDSASAVGPTEAVDNDLTTSTEQPGLPSNAEKPKALLQLLDGSMYGLTRYWLEGTTLHYVTTYGGENSVPLERIDFTKTLQLNAEQGTPFDLTQNHRNP